MIEDQGNSRVWGGPVPVVEQQKLVDAHFQSWASYWREIYQLNDVYAVIHQQRREVVLDLVDEVAPPGSDVLEVGCGAGLTTVALAQRGYVVQAMDSVPAMLDLTRQAAAGASVGHRVVTSMGDVHRMAFPANRFSLVLAIGVTPWLHSLKRAMREMARVLMPGGYLIVNVDNRWRLNDVLDPWWFPGLRPIRSRLGDFLRRLKLRRPVPRIHRYSLKEFDAILGEVGLEKLKGMTLGFGPFSFLNYQFLPESVGLKIHCKLQEFADRSVPVVRSAGAQYIVLARKSSPH